MHTQSPLTTNLQRPLTDGATPGSGIRASQETTPSVQPLLYQQRHPTSIQEAKPRARFSTTPTPAYGFQLIAHQPPITGNIPCKGPGPIGMNVYPRYTKVPEPILRRPSSVQQAPGGIKKTNSARSTLSAPLPGILISRVDSKANRKQAGAAENGESRLSRSSSKRERALSLLNINWGRLKLRPRAQNSEPSPSASATTSHRSVHFQEPADMEIQGHGALPVVQGVRRPRGSMDSEVSVKDFEHLRDGKSAQCDRKMTFDKFVPPENLGELSEEEKQRVGVLGRVKKVLGRGSRKVNALFGNGNRRKDGEQGA